MNALKPHIYRRDGFWWCASRVSLLSVIGDTPDEAYQNFVAQQMGICI